jgi:hypothetical protein
MANKDRWPMLRTSGPGYETQDKEQFDYQVEFNFDFSDVSVKTRQAKKLIGELDYQLYKELKNIKVDKSSGFVFAKEVTATNPASRGSISTKIKVFSDEGILEKDMQAFGVATSAEAKETIKKYIGSRIETGRMKESVYGRTKVRKGFVSATAGWLDLWYKYFGFQENGTFQIRPMHSMLRTYLELAPQVQKGVATYLRNYVRGSGYKPKAGK